MACLLGVVQTQLVFHVHYMDHPPLIHSAAWENTAACGRSDVNWKACTGLLVPHVALKTSAWLLKRLGFDFYTGDLSVN